MLYFQESPGADDTYSETGGLCGTAQSGRTVSTLSKSILLIHGTVMINLNGKIPRHPVSEFIISHNTF